MNPLFLTLLSVKYFVTEIGEKTRRPDTESHYFRGKSFKSRVIAVLILTIWLTGLVAGLFVEGMGMSLELQVSDDPEQCKEEKQCKKRMMERFGGHLEDQNAPEDVDKKDYA